MASRGTLHDRGQQQPGGSTSTDKAEFERRVPELDRDGLRKIILPAQDEGWEFQSEVYDTILEDLQANLASVIDHAESEPSIGQLRLRHGMLASARRLYVAWRSELDPEKTSKLYTDKDIFENVIDELDAIGGSIPTMANAMTKLNAASIGVELSDIDRTEPELDDCEPFNDIDEAIKDIDSAVRNLQVTTYMYHRGHISPFLPGNNRNEPSESIAITSTRAHGSPPSLLTSPVPVINVEDARKAVPPLYDGVSGRKPISHVRDYGIWIWTLSLLTFIVTILPAGLQVYMSLKALGDTKESADEPSSSIPVRNSRRFHHIPVLGAILLLGANEMNLKLGRLVSSPLQDYLPVMGTQVLAENLFCTRQVGYQLYNLNHGIVSADLAGWLTRWLASQDFDRHRTCVHLTVSNSGRWRSQPSLTPIMTLYTTVVLLAWGDVASVASIHFLVAGIIIRWYLLKSNRDAIDKTVDKLFSGDYADRSPEEKSLLLMPNDKAVVLKFPGNLIRVFTKDPKPLHPTRYRFARYASWVAFTGHIITLSMAALPMQIFQTFLLILGTLAVSFKVGSDDSTQFTNRKFDPVLDGDRNFPKAQERYSCRIGSRLTATVTEWDMAEVGWHSGQEPDRQPRRQDVYAWLDMTEEQESYMQRWNLFPIGGDHQKWFAQYAKKKEARQQWMNT